MSVGEGSQRILLSICETEMEQMTGHSNEQQSEGQRKLQIPSWLETDQDVFNRALSNTYSSLPNVFHPTIQGSGNVPLRFRCLESCLTVLCLKKNTCIDLTSNHPFSWEDTLSTRVPHSDAERRQRALLITTMSRSCRECFLGTISLPH